MANITLQTIAKAPAVHEGYTYNDLHLDLSFTYKRNNELLKQNDIKDIVTDYDYAAIKNSIRNIFLTIPGQKILNPAFGVNLFQYLFRPCDSITASQISKEIYACITKFEPRVLLQLVEVVALNGFNSTGPARNPYTEASEILAIKQTISDENTYAVNLTMSIPRINSSSFKLVGTLSNSGFIFNN